MGGISFTIPAVQDEIFSTILTGYNETAWSNFAFVLSGVVSGLLLGILST